MCCVLRLACADAGQMLTQLRHTTLFRGPSDALGEACLVLEMVSACFGIQSISPVSWCLQHVPCWQMREVADIQGIFSCCCRRQNSALVYAVSPCLRISAADATLRSVVQRMAAGPPALGLMRVQATRTTLSDRSWVLFLYSELWSCQLSLSLSWTQF